MNTMLRNMLIKWPTLKSVDFINFIILFILSVKFQVSYGDAIRQPHSTLGKVKTYLQSEDKRFSNADDGDEDIRSASSRKFEPLGSGSIPISETTASGASTVTKEIQYRGGVRLDRNIRRSISKISDRLNILIQAPDVANMRNTVHPSNLRKRSKRKRDVDKILEQTFRDELLFEILTLLISIREKMKHSQVEKKSFSNSPKNQLSADDEQNLMEITTLYSKLTKGEAEPPSFHIMEKHRNYLLKILHSLVHKKDINEEIQSHKNHLQSIDNKITNQLVSIPNNIDMDKLLNSSSSEGFLNLNNTTKLQTLGSSNSEMDGNSFVEDDVVIRSKQVMPHLSTQQELAQRTGEPADDLQNLDIRTAALLLHQMQTQGEVNLIPDSAMTNQIQRPSSYNLIYGDPPGYSNEISVTTRAVSIPEVQDFGEGLLEALQSAAIDELENSNILPNTGLFGFPSELSDYSAVADVLLAIEQLRTSTDPLLDDIDRQPLIDLASSNFENMNLDDFDASLIPELVQRLRLPPGTSTRLTPELTTAITDFLTSINDAITQLITDIQAAITENPLLGVLMVLGLALLFAHFFRDFFFKHGDGGGYGGGGHGGGGGGYHRRTGKYDQYDQYRMFNDSPSEIFTQTILMQLENFEKSLSNLDYYYEKYVHEDYPKANTVS